MKLRFTPGLTHEQKIGFFAAFLKEDALATFENLDRTVKMGTFENMVARFRKEIEGPLAIQKVHFQTQLMMYTKKAGQSVASMCLDIEKIARKAFPLETELGLREQMCCAALLKNLEGRAELSSYVDASMGESGVLMSSYASVKALALRHDAYLRLKPQNQDQETGKKVNAKFNRKPEQKNNDKKSNEDSKTPLVRKE